MIDLFGKKGNDKKQIKKKFQTFNDLAKKYPLIKVKEKNIQKIKEKYTKNFVEKKTYNIEDFVGFTDRTMIKLAKISMPFVRKIGFLSRQTESFARQISDEVSKAYLPLPSYAYASMLVMLITIGFIILPFFLIAMALHKFILATILAIPMVFSYLFTAIIYMRPSRKFKGSANEMLQLLGIWYGIANSNLSPQEQFEMIYKILLEYQRLNLKYGNLYPNFKLFDIFHDIHYSITYRNYSIVTALEEVIDKINDEDLKMFFMKVLRAIKEQGNVAPVIEAEYMKMIGKVQDEIEKSGAIVDMMAEMQVSLISMMGGNLFLMQAIMGSLTGYNAMISSLMKGFLMVAVVVLLISLLFGVIIFSVLSFVKPKRKIPYNVAYMGIAFLSFMLYPILLLSIPDKNLITLLIPSLTPLIVNVSGYLNTKRIKKIVNMAEEDFPRRLHEIANQIEMGMYLPDAILSTVINKNKLEYFNDWLFYTIGSYLKLGFTMKTLVETLIIKVPTDLIRVPMTVIALVEESAGKMQTVFENMAIYANNILSATNNVRDKLSMPKNLSIVVSALLLVITTYIMFIVLPELSLANIGNMNSGGIGAQQPNPQVQIKQNIQILEAHPFFYHIQKLLFPNTVENPKYPVSPIVGTISTVIYLITFVFAISSALSIALLDDNVTAPEFTFKFFLILTLFLAVSYFSGMKYAFNPAPIQKQSGVNSTMTFNATAFNH